MNSSLAEIILRGGLIVLVLSMVGIIFVALARVEDRRRFDTNTLPKDANKRSGHQGVDGDYVEFRKVESNDAQ